MKSLMYNLSKTFDSIFRRLIVLMCTVALAVVASGSSEGIKPESFRSKDWVVKEILGPPHSVDSPVCEKPSDRFYFNPERLPKNRKLKSTSY